MHKSIEQQKNEIDTIIDKSICDLVASACLAVAKAHGEDFLSIMQEALEKAKDDRRKQRLQRKEVTADLSSLTLTEIKLFGKEFVSFGRHDAHQMAEYLRSRQLGFSPNEALKQADGVTPVKYNFSALDELRLLAKQCSSCDRTSTDD